MKKQGFITALGTPLDNGGNFLRQSMIAHVESQLSSGAAALLCMGSMGQQAYISNSQYPLVAQTCADAANKKVPVYAGVSDVSVQRVVERIEALKGLAIDGVVSTVSYYGTLSQDEAVEFYRQIADRSAYPLYIYDLPQVSHVPLTADTVMGLMAHKNIHGIKSANITMLRKIKRMPDFDPKFKIFFSGLDIMDIVLKYGMEYMLDGMFSCTPVTSKKFGQSIADGDVKGASIALDQILKLRDTMVRYGLWSSFTYIMNRLGFPGYFNPDYVIIRDDGKDALDGCLEQMGEI